MTTPLTGLTDALERLGALVEGPVAPVYLPPAASVGRVLATDLTAGTDLPPVAVAARDGVAVRAAGLDGAGPYAPVMLARPARLAQGAPLPPGTDAVVAARDLFWCGELAALSAPVAPGEGVRAAGRDIAAGTCWRRHGARLSAWDLPLLAVREVSVRVPRVAVVPTGVVPGLDTLSPCLAALLAADGAAVQVFSAVAGRGRIAAALAGAAAQADLVIATGGTGDGTDDHTAAALGDAGLLAVHGIGLRPGTTAGFGAVAGVPVILLPGRPERGGGRSGGANHAQQRADRHCVALFGDNLAERAAGRRIDLQRHLVGLQFDQRLVRLHGVAALLEPFADGRFGYRFAERGNTNFCGHGSDAPRAAPFS